MPKRTYEEWKREVNIYILTLAGVTSEDLPDTDYTGMYQSGVSPKVAAKRAIRNARGY